MSDPPARRRHTVPRAFACALMGIWTLLRTERNARIHLLCALSVLGLGVWLRIGAMEWVAIVLCVTVVMCVEALNSAIERAVDHTSLETHPLAKQAKDIAAAAVLMAAAGATAVGAIVLLPKLIAALQALSS